jgi:hypothetical protein
VSYLHPDKIKSVSTILRGKRKAAKAKPASDGLTMIERMASQIHAERGKRGR